MFYLQILVYLQKKILIIFKLMLYYKKEETFHLEMNNLMNKLLKSRKNQALSTMKHASIMKG